MVVLGATGSIGRQTLDVSWRHRDRFRIVALAAGSDLDGLVALARECGQRGVALQALGLERAADASRARDALASVCPAARIEVGAGSAARLAGECAADAVVNGIVGAAGLDASLATLAAGRRLALANKETLVIGAELVQRALASGGELIPVDSEHSAALLCLGGRPASEVARLTLTASGGPLRDHRNWRQASVAEVLAHPVWAMGRRITVDSALLVNKALELIEARALFGLDWSQLDAVIHPQARFHALVAFRDGALVAQAAAADMRLPIQLALSWPEHWEGPVPPLAAPDLARLDFEAIAPGRFPAFDLGVAVGKAGGTAPCAYNAADEEAVAAFLDGRIPLGRVVEILEQVMAAHDREAVSSRAQLAAVDEWARRAARERVAA
ncbi:MAG: 1-deoxy-D-xylulose-5-phosphate reductoisomerase [Candidatus Eisenbacteria bacterium]|uniref:1-deoxy-D-xylulose 5-phosphate reductoisomerase n=1 Tax=Eiseniibacteriota bacterium TaxID=2212470 RepID=A0A849SK59_UNCEI|nr:1-deoxy-D-xylulose-5-phosphate reductoisomerase [Candidatus Eisenbacteria bacterium]